MSEVGWVEQKDEYRTHSQWVQLVAAPHKDKSVGAGLSDTSGKIYVGDADSLALRAKNGGTSTDLDVFVYASDDGSDFDTEPYASILALGNGKSKTIPLSKTVRYIQVKVVNNDTVNSATVNTRVFKQPRRRRW